MHLHAALHTLSHSTRLRRADAHNIGNRGDENFAITNFAYRGQWLKGGQVGCGMLWLPHPGYQLGCRTTKP